MREETGTSKQPNTLLRQQRELRGWSRARMAEELHLRFPGIAVTDKDIARWERGKRVPGPYYREKLCALFEKTAVDLGFIERISTKSSEVLLLGEEKADEQVPLDSQRQSTSIIRLTAEQLAVLQIVLGEKGMKYFDPSKRRTLQQIAIAIGAITASSHMAADPEPWERLLAARKRSAKTLNAEAFDRFEHLIGEAWKLSNINEMEAAEGVLSSFLPKITSLSHREVDARTAYLASQGLRLQSILFHHRMQIGDKIVMCQQAVDYARYANDINTLVAALLELAVAYKYNGQPDKWFHTIQEALYYVTQASPLLQSQAYFKSALAFAYQKRKKEAELYVQMGSDMFPDHPEFDVGYALADSNIYTFSRDAGRAYVEMGQTSNAYSAFEIYKSSTLPIPERLRLEIVNAQSRAAILENELEKYAFFLRDGLSGALTLGSKKRFDEAYTTFKEDMPASWLKNREIQDIAEMYRLQRAR